MIRSPSSVKDRPSAAHLKRCEQVRRAQRTHRERKETYVHALESEVLVLRTKAKIVEEQNNKLSAQVIQLERKANAQSVGSEAWSAGWETGDEDVVSHVGGDHGERWLNMDVIELGEVCDVPEQTCNAMTRRTSGSKSWSISASQADMAMEFVLTLEKPCIMWAQPAVFDPLNAYPSNIPPDHNELALYHAFVEDKLVAPDLCTQKDVVSSLDNLLSLSSAFDLENEVTPIQAWQHLCGYLELSAVHMKGFRKLEDALLGHVRCYGFGAVISRSVFDATCNRIFTIGN